MMLKNSARPPGGQREKKEKFLSLTVTRNVLLGLSACPLKKKLAMRYIHVTTCTCTFVLQCVGVSKAPPRVYTVETTAGVVRSCHLTANSGS